MHGPFALLGITPSCRSGDIYIPLSTSNASPGAKRWKPTLAWSPGPIAPSIDWNQVGYPFCACDWDLGPPILTIYIPPTLFDHVNIFEPPRLNDERLRRLAAHLTLIPRVLRQDPRRWCLRLSTTDLGAEDRPGTYRGFPTPRGVEVIDTPPTTTLTQRKTFTLTLSPIVSTTNSSRNPHSRPQSRPSATRSAPL